MQVQQHARGCGATSWRSHCFHNPCRVGPQTASGSHKSSPSGPRTLRTHRAFHRHVQRSSAGAKPGMVTCQAQEPVAQRMSVKVGDIQMTLETGEIGRQANGAVTLTYGDTVLYTTACCSQEATGDGSFIPLQVNYSERFSAAGKTSGGFIKRDGRSRESEVLVSRLTDRPLRPMFEKGWNRETQVLTWVLSYDGEQSPEPLAITAASAALCVSECPLVAWAGSGWGEGLQLLLSSEVSCMLSTLLQL